jgi:hypothetical protein
MKTATTKIAKYNTKCPQCGFKFIPGKDIIKVHHNVWVHEGCYDEYREKIDEQNETEVYTETDKNTGIQIPLTSPVYGYQVITKEMICKTTNVDASSIQEAMDKVTMHRLGVEVVEVKKL